MATFDPARQFGQGLQLGQNIQAAQRQNKITGLQNTLSGQIQQGGFDPSQSLEFEELNILDPISSKNILNTFSSLKDSRKKAIFEDAKKAKKFLENQDFNGFQNLVSDRIKNIQRLGGDTSGSISVLSRFQSGDIKGTINQLNNTVKAGILSGFLPDPEKGRRRKIQTKTAEEKNFEKRQEIERTGTPQQLAIFDKLLGLQKDPKLSNKAEKAIIDSQDAFFKAGESARKMELLADDVGRLNIGAGLASTVSETFKNILGSQDDVSALRKRFNAIRSSQATANLPPGPASDKDIALALSGFPKENANAQQIIGFLRGQAKLSRIDEKFNEFKAEFIADKNSVKGLIKEWKSNLNDDAFLLEILSPVDRLKAVQSAGELSDDDLFN